MAFYGQLTGNLGRDPELRYLDNGRVVANFTVAVRQNKRQGQDAPARWVKVAVWGKPAEYVGNYVRKGDKVALFGRVEPPEQFTDRNGQQRLTEVFTAENIEKWSDGGQQQQAQPAAASQQQWQPDPSRGTVAAAPLAPAQHPAYAAAGHQPAAAPAPTAGTPAWNSAPLDPPDDDGIPF